MAISYFVRYQGLAQPRDRFLRHYRDVHAGILAEFPGLRGLTLHTPAPGADPFPTQPDGTDFLAQMVFDDPAALRTALESEARARARADFANLAVGDARVTHQAMVSESLL